MPRTQDPETGQFETVYDDDEFLDVLDTTTGTGTREVAETLGCSQNHAYLRLRELANEGRVNSQTIGGTNVWTLATDANRGEHA
jgi:predicted HTH transcriptional regulator